MSYNDWMSIRDFFTKIKSFARYPSADLLIVALVVLVGSAGFGLGRLSAVDGKKADISIQYPVTAAASEATVEEEGTVNTSGNVVASKNGTKYHFPWCAGAAQISEKNKITFASAKEAQEAGYTPASNCKGLK